jgi:hypothetical protein
MRNRSKLLIAAFTAAALLSFAVGTASARRIEEIERPYRMEWTSYEIRESGVIIRCPMTVLGSFHSRTISKVSGQLIGYITKVTIAESACMNGMARALTETLPWHNRFNGFTGTLPRITGFDLVWSGARFFIRVTEGLSCLVGTEPAHPGVSILNVEANGTVRSVRVDETASIPLGGGILCEGGEATEAGTGAVFAGTTGTTQIVERLVQ